MHECNDLLVNFCKTFERLYGGDACNPIIHLHCHIREYVYDYGTANAFWLFACERMDGILGSVSSNHHAIDE